MGAENPNPALASALQETMNIVFVGHVDHGKSTVIGRMLADTGRLPEGKLEQVQALCERNGESFEYAYLIDALKDERAQSITIDSARVFFQSDQRHYIIIDSPGHIEFIKNMVTGASRAEAAVLVIDAKEGVRENSRRHGYLLWMLGIRHIIVAINKMDMVDYREDVFEAVRTEYESYMDQIGLQPQRYIPVSAVEGENVARKSDRMSWYSGGTILEALDSLEKEKPPDDLPFRMPVQDIYKFSRMGDERRIVAGTVVSGQVHVGDELIFLPSGKRSVLKSLETFHAPARSEARAGEAIGFTLDEQIYIQRGQVVARADEPPPAIAKRVRVSLFWLGRQPLVMNTPYVMKIGTARVEARVERIHRIIDASDYSTRTAEQVIGHNDVAECTLLLKHPIAFDLCNTISETSRFVLVDGYEIWGGGIVLEPVPDEESGLLDETIFREQKWIKSNVSMIQRAEKYNQRPALIIVTGKKGAGRKRLASAVERKLFDEGKMVYYLGIGSVLYGVNADLKRAKPGNNWHEHLRRMAQIAHLFLDAGLFLLLTAVELQEEDLRVFRSIIDPTLIETIWIGDIRTTDLAVDLQVSSNEDVDKAVERIKQMLQDHGSIFSPNFEMP